MAECERLSGGVVAPHWGAWIEIFMRTIRAVDHVCRTPLGCVD